MANEPPPLSAHDSGPFFHGTKADLKPGDLLRPGNPTRSYRTQHPLRVIEEVLDWEGHSPETLQVMRDHLGELKRLGIEAIND
jgi:hypothetical protein